MYSNCLIEAIKAKIKDPKNVHIISPRKKWNDGNRHFYWIKDNQVYHYEAPSERAGILFKGTFKQQSMETFEAFWLRRLARMKPLLDKTVVAKKMNFPSLTMPGMIYWATYCPELGQVDIPVKNRLAKLVMIKNNNSEIKIIKTDEFNKDDYECIDWKYVSPYCQEFNLFGVNES